MNQGTSSAIVEAAIGGGKTGRLEITLGPADVPQAPDEYLFGTLSIDKADWRVAFPLRVERSFLRDFLSQARSLSSDHLEAGAILWDYDRQSVLVLGWVAVVPPVLVISGKRTSYLFPSSDPWLKNVNLFPYGAQDQVQYSGMEITLEDLEKLTAGLQSVLDKVGP